MDISAHSQVMASTDRDESTITPGGEPSSAPCDLWQQTHLAKNGRRRFMQIHRKYDDIPSEPDPYHRAVIWLPNWSRTTCNMTTGRSQLCTEPDKYHAIVIEISQRWIALPKYFTIRCKYFVDVCSKRDGNSRTATFKPSNGNSSGRAVLAQGVLEEDERTWQGTRPWGTTQIPWIYEISDRASENKSWEILRRRAENSQCLHWNNPSQWSHHAIIACSTNALICEETQWPTTAVCGLPSHE